MMRLVAVAVITMMPLAAAAEGCRDRQTAMSCAEGFSLDPQTGTCTPVATS